MLPKLSDGFVDAIMANLYSPPTCAQKQRATVIKLQLLFHDHPEKAEVVRKGLRDDPKKAAMSLEYWKARSDGFVKITNEFLQNYRVLCVTTDKASDRMWQEYAEADQGIALRITPNVEKNSKFQLFTPVIYQEKRPAVFSKASDFAAETIFGDLSERASSILRAIIYAKTEYRFESEYRLAIPLGEGEEDYRTLSYHPEEITELYLGAAMTDKDRQEILAAAKDVNPAISIFQAKRGARGKLSFDTV